MPEPTREPPLLIDEFEIVELEDRLELVGRCNGVCSEEIIEPTSSS